LHLKRAVLCSDCLPAAATAQVRPRLTVAAFDSGVRKAAPRGSPDARRAARAAASATASAALPPPAQRRGDPLPLAAALAALRIPCVIAPPDGAQGDDVLASLAAALAGSSLRGVIASGDADCQAALGRRSPPGAGGVDWLRVAPHPSAAHPAVLELVTWQARWQRARARARACARKHLHLFCGILHASRLTLLLRHVSPPACRCTRAQSFFERYGFGPERYALLGALLGRPRDGVPRVVGVGDRAAAALVRAHGTADAILHAAGALERASSSSACGGAALPRRLLWLFCVCADVRCASLARMPLQLRGSCARFGRR
jgi:hypothetical protein